ncbi:MAG: hypothetical protein ACOYEH_04210, partial [Caldicoprobacterales bacterium]
MYIVFKSRKFNNHYGNRNLRTATKVFSVLLIVSLLAQVLTGCITQSDSMADDESKVDIVSDSDDV